MPYSLLRKVFCPIIFWQTTEHRVWGFLPSPGEASAAKAKSRKSKDSKKLPFLRRPWEDQHSSTELLCPTWSHIVPRRANSFWGQWRERERENGCHCIYVREWLMLTPVPYRIEISATSISFLLDPQPGEKRRKERPWSRELAWHVVGGLWRIEGVASSSEESIGPCEAGWNMETILAVIWSKLLTFQEVVLLCFAAELLRY